MSENINNTNAQETPDYLKSIQNARQNLSVMPGSSKVIEGVVNAPQRAPYNFELETQQNEQRAKARDDLSGLYETYQAAIQRNSFFRSLKNQGLHLLEQEDPEFRQSLGDTKIQENLLRYMDGSPILDTTHQAFILSSANHDEAIRRKAILEQQKDEDKVLARLGSTGAAWAGFFGGLANTADNLVGGAAGEAYRGGWAIRSAINAATNAGMDAGQRGWSGEQVHAQDLAAAGFTGVLLTPKGKAAGTTQAQPGANLSTAVPTQGVGQVSVTGANTAGANLMNSAGINPLNSSFGSSSSMTYVPHLTPTATFTTNVTQAINSTVDKLASHLDDLHFSDYERGFLATPEGTKWAESPEGKTWINQRVTDVVEQNLPAELPEQFRPKEVSPGEASVEPVVTPEVRQSPATPEQVEAKAEEIVSAAPTAHDVATSEADAISSSVATIRDTETAIKVTEAVEAKVEASDKAPEVKAEIKQELADLKEKLQEEKVYLETPDTPDAEAKVSIPDDLLKHKVLHPQSRRVVKFESQIDKALYIVGGNKNKLFDTALGVLKKHFPDLSEVQIRAEGKKLRMELETRNNLTPHEGRSVELETYHQDHVDANPKAEPEPVVISHENPQPLPEANLIDEATRDAHLHKGYKEDSLTQAEWQQLKARMEFDAKNMPKEKFVQTYGKGKDLGPFNPETDGYLKAKGVSGFRVEHSSFFGEGEVPNTKAVVYRDLKGDVKGYLEFNVDANGKLVPYGIETGTKGVLTQPTINILHVAPSESRTGLVKELFRVAKDHGYDLGEASGQSITKAAAGSIWKRINQGEGQFTQWEGRTGRGSQGKEAELNRKIAQLKQQEEFLKDRFGAKRYVQDLEKNAKTPAEKKTAEAYRKNYDEARVKTAGDVRRERLMAEEELKVHREQQVEAAKEKLEEGKLLEETEVEALSELPEVEQRKVLESKPPVEPKVADEGMDLLKLPEEDYKSTSLKDGQRVLRLEFAQELYSRVGGGVAKAKELMNAVRKPSLFKAIVGEEITVILQRFHELRLDVTDKALLKKLDDKIHSSSAFTKSANRNEPIGDTVSKLIDYHKTIKSAVAELEKLTPEGSTKVGQAGFITPGMAIGLAGVSGLALYALSNPDKLKELGVGGILLLGVVGGHNKSVLKALQAGQTTVQTTHGTIGVKQVGTTVNTQALPTVAPAAAPTATPVNPNAVLTVNPPKRLIQPPLSKLFMGEALMASTRGFTRKVANLITTTFRGEQGADGIAKRHMEVLRYDYLKGYEKIKEDYFKDLGIGFFNFVEKYHAEKELRTGAFRMAAGILSPATSSPHLSKLLKHSQAVIAKARQLNVDESAAHRLFGFTDPGSQIHAWSTMALAQNYLPRIFSRDGYLAVKQAVGSDNILKLWEMGIQRANPTWTAGECRQIARVLKDTHDNLAISGNKSGFEVYVKGTNDEVRKAIEAGITQQGLNVSSATVDKLMDLIPWREYDTKNGTRTRDRYHMDLSVSVDVNGKTYYLADLYENDINRLTESYSRQAVGWTALAKVSRKIPLGTGAEFDVTGKPYLVKVGNDVYIDMTHDSAIGYIRQLFDNQQGKGRPLDEEWRDIEIILDHIKGYPRSNGILGSAAEDTLTILRNSAQVMFGGLFMLGPISEFFGQINNRTAKAFFQMMPGFYDFVRNKEGVSEWIANTGMGGDMLLERAYTSRQGTLPLIATESTYFAKNVGVATLYLPILNYLKRRVGEVRGQWLVNLANKGKTLSELDLKHLEEWGIKRQDVPELMKMLKDHVETGSFGQVERWNFDKMKANHPDRLENFIQYVYNYSHKANNELLPSQGLRVMEDPIIRSILQFNSSAIGSHYQGFTYNMRHLQDPETWTSMMFSLAGAAISYVMTVNIRYAGDEKKLKEKLAASEILKNAIGRAAFVGGAPKLFDLGYGGITGQQFFERTRNSGGLSIPALAAAQALTSPVKGGVDLITHGQTTQQVARDVVGLTGALTPYTMGFFSAMTKDLPKNFDGPTK